ncbi:flagellar protein FlgN [Terrilactibacillus sp. S3-3]|nr:flagellar protein FlgN [Terrilactibacillus sp. S3-3]
MTVSKVRALIEQLIAGNERLYEIAKVKTEAIKNADIQTLNSLVKQEQPIIVRIEKLERARMQMMTEIMQTAGVLGKGELPSLSKWRETIVPVSEKEEWETLHLQLANVLYVLKKHPINHLNQDLLRQSLQFVRLSLNLLHPRPTLKNYSKSSGRQEGSSSFSVRIDSRA